MSKPPGSNAFERAKLFSDLTPAARERAVELSERRVVPRGGFFFHQGDPARSCHVLTGGRVKIVQLTPEGSQVVLRVLGPGEMFGCVAVLGDRVYPASGEAVEDSTALVWSDRALLRLMEEHPRIALNALEIIGERLREIQVRYRELATARVERRVASSLVRLASQAGRKVDEGILIDFSLSRQDLAEMTGTTLFTVSRILSSWEEQGLVASGRQRVVIRNPHGLMKIAEEL